MRTRTVPAWPVGVAFAASLWWTAPEAASQAQAPARPAPSAEPSHRSTLDTYCVTCHNQRLKTGGLALDAMSLARVPADAATWERVIRKVRTGAMPPAGLPRPDPVLRDGLVTWLETSIDRAAAAAE